LPCSKSPPTYQVPAFWPEGKNLDGISSVESSVVSIRLRQRACRGRFRGGRCLSIITACLPSQAAACVGISPSIASPRQTNTPGAFFALCFTARALESSGPCSITRPSPSLGTRTGSLSRARIGRKARCPSTTSKPTAAPTPLTRAGTTRRSVPAVCHALNLGLSIACTTDFQSVGGNLCRRTGSPSYPKI